MKIRNGFVSNSSSSSFICLTCGREGSGMDISVSELEMIECKNVHIMCREHLTVNPFNIDGFEDMCSDVDNDEENGIAIVTKFCESNNIPFPTSLVYRRSGVPGEKINVSDLQYGYEFPIEWCPYCQLEMISDEHAAKILFSKIPKEEILKDIKTTYTTYANFSKKMDTLDL